MLNLRTVGLVSVAGIGAVVAVLVGTQVVVETVAPMGDFSLLLEIPINPVAESPVRGGEENTYTASAVNVLTTASKPSPVKVEEKIIQVEIVESREEVSSAVIVGLASSSERISVPAISGATLGNESELNTNCSYQTNQFPSYRNLIFSEIAWMGTQEDSGSEWIELKNISDHSVNVRDYWVIDQKEQIKIQLPDRVVPPGGFYLLERGDDAVPFILADAVYTGALSNSNEGLRLFDSWCLLLDQAMAEPNWPAGNSGERRSMERGSNLEWYTYSGSSARDIFGTPLAENSIPSGILPSSTPSNAPTPATSIPSSSLPPTNHASSSNVSTSSNSSHLLISEVMVGSETSADDEFIELYNLTGQMIDLTGWSIKKRSSTGSEASLVSASRLKGKSLPHGQHFLIGHEGGYMGVVNATWAKSYSLAYSNNAIILYDGGGSKIDEASWSSLEKGQSWARQGDSGAFEVSAINTPQGL